MISKSLNRRLKELESLIQPAVTEPIVIRLDYVDGDGTVVDHEDFIVNAPPPKVARTHPWRRR
jgi:hypothetical protein